jgi:hypothetical protein
MNKRIQKGDRKAPVHLTNDFIRNLIGGQMWWDDDPKATGFGIRAYPLSF